MIRWGFRDPGTSEVQVCGTGKGFDVAFDDVRGVRRGRALRPRFAGMSAGRREFAGTRGRERGRGSQKEMENEGGRSSIRRDGRGRGTSYAVERLNYCLWYASPNELGYASTNLQTYARQLDYAR